MAGRFAGLRPSHRRRGAAVMVALGVQGLLMLLLAPRLPERADRTARPAVSVRLVTASPQRRNVSAPPMRVPAQPADRRRPTAAPAERAAPAAPVTVAGPTATEEAAPPAAPRLNLALPGPDLVAKRSAAVDVRTAALNDPRANSVKPRFDERLALAAGNAECVIATRQPDGSTLRRFGRLVYLETLHAAATNVKDLVPVCVE